MNYANTYQDELLELHHRRVYHITVVGGLLMMLSAILDYLVVPALFQEFIGYRLTIVGFSIVLLFLNYLDTEQRHATMIGFTEYLFIAAILLFLIYRTGGTTSPYYVGLILTMTIYSTLAPLTAIQSMFSCFFVVFCYAITLQIGQDSFSYSLDIFSNLFFMICFVLIIATQSWTDTTGRKNEYQLRIQEDQANKELSRHVVILEDEVAKRTVEQAATEERYRLLFDQIADDVVVLTPEGTILQSNESFDTNYLPAESNNSPSFFEIVRQSDQKVLKNVFTNIITSGLPVQACKLSLVRNDSSTCDTEINLSLITRNQTDLGILLVIRDISTRIHLEERLRVSLNLKKHTESAAIMALSKLSEYRDVTPGKHLERIREYSKILAIQLARHQDFIKIIDPDFIQDIYHAAILHDIGKVSIPDQLLGNTTPVTDEEKEIIRRHTIAGGDVIKEMEEESQQNSFLTMAKDIAYFHHERWDGNGYPSGLREENIPLSARILALADSYEEMTTSCHDNIPSSHEIAAKAIINNSEFHFDSRIVEAFFLRQEEFKLIRTKFAET